MHLSSSNPQGNFNLCDLCVARTPLCSDHCNLRAPVHFFLFWKRTPRKALKLSKYTLTARVGWNRVSNPAGADKKGILTTYSPSLGNERYWQGKIRSKGICFCLYFLLVFILKWSGGYTGREMKGGKSQVLLSASSPPWRWQLCSFQQNPHFLPGQRQCGKLGGSYFWVKKISFPEQKQLQHGLCFGEPPGSHQHLWHSVQLRERTMKCSCHRGAARDSLTIREPEGVQSQLKGWAAPSPHRNDIIQLWEGENCIIFSHKELCPAFPRFVRGAGIS